MKSVHPRRLRRFISRIGFLDLLCLIFTYLIIAQLVGIGTIFYRSCDGLACFKPSIRSFNSVVYLLRASGGNFSDALTPEQVLAKFEAAQSDETALTIHSILTSSVRPSHAWPETTASKANRMFWNAEKQTICGVNAVAG